MIDREILLWLRKKKFTLLSRWKRELESVFPLDVDNREKVPPSLLFRSYDKLLSQLRQEEPLSPGRPESSVIRDLPSARGVRAQVLLKTLLSGEETMGCYLAEDLNFRKQFSVNRSSIFQKRFYRAFHRLILEEIKRLPESAGSESVQKRREAVNGE